MRRAGLARRRNRKGRSRGMFLTGKGNKSSVKGKEEGLSSLSIEMSQMVVLKVIDSYVGQWRN